MLVTSRKDNADGWWRLRIRHTCMLEVVVKMESRMERGGWLKVFVGSEKITDGVRASAVRCMSY